MNAVSLDRIKVTGTISLQSVLSLHVQAKVNEHAYMHIHAVLSEADGEKYCFQPHIEAELCLQCDFGEGYRPCFTGKITEAAVSNENGTYFIDAVCVSGSRQFDKVMRSRSFQDVSMPYQELLSQVAAQTGNIVPIKAKDEPIGYPIIQYQETDWEFVRRLASRFHTVIIPEICYAYPQISFGVIHGKTYELGSPLSYSLIKNVTEFRAKSAEYSCKLSDFVCYRVRDYRHFELGDKVLFKKYPLIVMEKEMDLSDGLLEFTYTLGTEEAFGLLPYFNEKASGLTLEGKVLWTSGEKVKIKLDIDEKQETGSAYPFSYVPETGNIMYSMPETGARISLYLPSADESGAMAVGCRQPDDDLPHHYHKFMRTPSGKQLAINPGKLAFHTRKKSARSTVSIADRLGAGIETSRSIRMSAQKTVDFETDESCLAKAGIAVRLLQSNTSFIEIAENTLSINAQKILTSTLKAPADTVFKKVERVSMPEPADGAGAALGGIPIGGALDSVAAALLGAIPGSCSPAAKCSLSSIGKMFQQH